MFELEPSQLLLIGAVAIGLAFGAVAQATAFCSSGAILDFVRSGNGNRMRAWGVALAVAILSTQFLVSLAVVDLQTSIYLATPLNIAGPIFGGFIFGVGMMLAHGCASRNLVRLGSGNLRALIVVIILAITAYATLRGILAPGRMLLERLTRADLGGLGLPEIIAGSSIASAEAARWIVALAAAAALLAACFKSRAFRGSPSNIFAGVAIGLLIAAGWYLTGVLAQDPFNPSPPASFTFVSPLGDSLEYLMIFTGMNANFGVAIVGGVLLGSFLSSLLRGEFRVQGFGDKDDFFLQIGGAALMGIGGVFAMGCTVGQGLTGVSTLSFGSSLAALSICLGGFVGEWLTRKPAGNTRRALSDDAAPQPGPQAALLRQRAAG